VKEEGSRSFVLLIVVVDDEMMDTEGVSTPYEEDEQYPLLLQQTPEGVGEEARAKKDVPGSVEGVVGTFLW